MSNAEKTIMFALPNMMSGKLACVAGSAAGRSWDLSAGTFTIGRQDEHDMSLPQEPGISKLHAKIIGQGDRYLITDCESRNGTLLNGELIQRGDLYDGDEIRICGCVLRFTQKGGPARPRPRAAEPVAVVAPVVAAVPAFVAPTVVPMMAPPPASSGAGALALWFAAGLVGSLLLGGAASAALVVNAAERVAPVVRVAAVAVVAPVVAPPVFDVVVADAGIAAVETVAAAEAAAAVPDIDAAAADEKPVELALDEPKTVKAPKNTPKPAASLSVGGTFAASVDGGRAETLRSKTGGRVRTVEVKDGAEIVKGTILVTFEAGADGDEIATLEDRIASLEAVEGEEAQRDLRQAKARLAALEGGQKATPITAGINGKLTGFSISAGTVLKAGEVVGTLVDGEVSMRVRVTVSRGTSAKAGQKVSFTLTSGGTGEGIVVAVSGRVVTVDTGSVAGDTVDTVTFE